MGTSDGQVKQSAFTDYKPGSRYKSRTTAVIKLMRNESRLVSVDYYEPTNENRSLLVISHEGYAVRFDVADVPVTGLRTGGVRAINLKDADYATDFTLVSEGQNLAMITQRGAFKEMASSDIETGARARRGELVIHRIKNHPHKIVDFLAYDPNNHDVLEIITDRPAFQDVAVDDHHLGTAKSNGTFVVDTDTQGTPVKLKRKQVNILNEEPVNQEN